MADDPSDPFGAAGAGPQENDPNAQSAQPAQPQPAQAGSTPLNAQTEQNLQQGPGLNAGQGIPPMYAQNPGEGDINAPGTSTERLTAQQLDQIMSKPFDDHVSKGTDAVIKEVVNSGGSAAGGTDAAGPGAVTTVHSAGGALMGNTGDLSPGKEGRPGVSGTLGPDGKNTVELGASGGPQPPMGTQDWHRGPDGKPVIDPPGSTAAANAQARATRPPDNVVGDPRSLQTNSPQDVTSPKGLGTITASTQGGQPTRGAAPSGKGSGITVDGVDPFEKYDSADVREALTMSGRNIPKALAILKADAEQGQTRKSALDVAGAKATSAENVARMTGQNRLDIANVRVQGNIDVEGIKSAAAQQIATNKITNPGLAKQWDLLRGMAQGGASADVLNHQMQEMGINPKQFNAQQQPAQQQPAQGDQGEPLPPGGQAALKKNTVYRLPNGPMTWTGTGFINQPKVAAPGNQ